MFSDTCKGYRDIKYGIQRLNTSLENCFSCKLSADRCGSVHESASVCFISVFFGRSSVNRLN